MKNLLSCCQIINSAQTELNQIPVNIPDAPEEVSNLYICTTERGLKLASNGLEALSKKTCDPECCQVASDAIVQSTQNFFNILDQVNTSTSNTIDLPLEYKKALSCLKHLIELIVKGSKNPKSCCVESGRALAISNFNLDSLQFRLCDIQPQLGVINNVAKNIQCAFDKLYKVDLSFECCLELTQNLIQLQAREITFLTTQLITEFEPQLVTPLGIAIRGNLAYVVDIGTSDIRVFNILTGKFVSSFGGSNLVNPQAIAIQGNRAYVTDDTLLLIVEFNLDTQTFVKNFEAGQFQGVTGIAIRGNLAYALNNGANDSVKVFNIETGDFVSSFGEANLGEPLSIAIQGNKAYVADDNVGSIVEFNLDTETFIRNFESGQFDDPVGMAIRCNLIYAADSGFDDVRVFNIITGDFVPPPLFGDQLENPTGIAIVGNQAYITDTVLNQIVQFNLDSGFNLQTEQKFFQAVLKQLVDPCQLNQHCSKCEEKVEKEDCCCLSSLLTQIYLDYSDTELTLDRNANLRKFTQLVYQQLSKLQNTQIENVKCCTQAFEAIQAIYENALRTLEAICRTSATQGDCTVFKVALDQINSVIQRLIC